MSAAGDGSAAVRAHTSAGGARARAWLGPRAGVHGMRA